MASFRQASATDAATLPQESMKPNLFIVGAPKCGTTAWVEYLRTHPDIFFPAVKEPHHFSTDSGLRRRIADRGSYLELYADAGPARIVGDGSASHLYSKTAARNIREFNPDAKVIILLRDRASFLRSWHNELYQNGAENIADFEQAWRLSGRRDRRNTRRRFRAIELSDYKACARFGEQVERYFAEFPADRIRVFHFDDWSPDPRRTYLEIMRFLDVQDDGRTEFPRVNEARRHRSVAIRRWLASPPRLIRAPVRLIKSMTGRESLGLADKVQSLNSSIGYRAPPLPPRLVEEIERYYEDDDRLLEKRIWRAP